MTAAVWLVGHLLAFVGAAFVAVVAAAAALGKGHR